MKREVECVREVWRPHAMITRGAMSMRGGAHAAWALCSHHTLSFTQSHWEVVYFAAQGRHCLYSSRGALSVDGGRWWRDVQMDDWVQVVAGAAGVLAERVAARVAANTSCSVNMSCSVTSPMTCRRESASSAPSLLSLSPILPLSPPPPAASFFTQLPHPVRPVGLPTAVAVTVTVVCLGAPNYVRCLRVFPPWIPALGWQSPPGMQVSF
jgi:hypothetical protein